MMEEPETFQEAILWHGGEASQSSKEAYMHLNKKERNNFIRIFRKEL